MTLHRARAWRRRHNGAMDQDTARSLRDMLEATPTAALATLHRGAPGVSMVPWVWSPTLEALLIHVSALATHTADMQAQPQVALLVSASQQAQVSPQATARVALQCEACFLDKEDAATYAQQRGVYLQRFPDAELMFGLADFSLVALRPRSARLVAGFAQAHSLLGEALLAWLRGA